MADNQEEVKNEEVESQEETSEKKKSNLLVILILVLVVILLSIGVYFLISVTSSDNDSAEEVEKEEIIVPSVFYSVPEIIVSLAGNTSNIRYLKLVLSFELSKESDQQVVEKLLPKVIDEYQTYLRQLRLEDLRGSIGTFRLKESLLLRVNQVVQPVEVKDVLIKEMLIQ